MDDQLYNCLGCGYVGPEVGPEDECPTCSARFLPGETPEGSCPGCNCSYLRSTCPKCGAADDFGTVETMPGWVNKKQYRAEQKALTSPRS